MSDAFSIFIFEPTLVTTYLSERSRTDLVCRSELCFHSSPFGSPAPGDSASAQLEQGHSEESVYHPYPNTHPATEQAGNTRVSACLALGTYGLYNFIFSRPLICNHMSHCLIHVHVLIMRWNPSAMFKTCKLEYAYTENFSLTWIIYINMKKVIGLTNFGDPYPGA